MEKRQRTYNAAPTFRGPTGPRDKVCKICKWKGDKDFFKGLTCKECLQVRRSKDYLTPGHDELGGKG